MLPTLESRASSRIVNVASAGQQPIDFTDVMLTRGYSGARAYRQSKLAQIMFTLDLAQELAGRNVAVNCLHPATFMDTTMVRLSGVQPISTVEEGGAAILELVMSPSLERASGLYFNGMRESRADPQAYDAEARGKLRALSFDLVGLADPLESAHLIACRLNNRELERAMTDHVFIVGGTSGIGLVPRHRGFDSLILV